MKLTIIPESLWDQLRTEFITADPEVNCKPLAEKWNVSWTMLKDKARKEHWRAKREQWQKNKVLPDTTNAEPILTTNTGNPIVRDFFHHFWRRYINVLPRLAADAERLSERLMYENEPANIHTLVSARDKVLERTRIMLGVMAPGMIKEIPRAKRSRLPAPTPSLESLTAEPVAQEELEGVNGEDEILDPATGLVTNGGPNGDGPVLDVTQLSSAARVKS